MVVLSKPQRYSKLFSTVAILFRLLLIIASGGHLSAASRAIEQYDDSRISVAALCMTKCAVRLHAAPILQEHSYADPPTVLDKGQQTYSSRPVSQLEITVADYDDCGASRDIDTSCESITTRHTPIVEIQGVRALGRASGGYLIRGQQHEHRSRVKGQPNMPLLTFDTCLPFHDKSCRNYQSAHIPSLSTQCLQQLYIFFNELWF